MERRGVGGLVVALAVHGLLLLLLVAPIGLGREVEALARGAGGAEPAGGGGGGRLGLEGGNAPRERLRYVRIAPPAARPPPVPPSATRVAARSPAPSKVTPPPPTGPVPPVRPEVNVQTDLPAPEIDLALDAGVGGGNVRSGGPEGRGPGSSRGIGSGEGTGRGSAAGPGAGGGRDVIHPPTPDFTPIPPWPVPAKLKGHSVVLLFTVDRTGRTVRLEFKPTRDGDYNRKIRETYAEARFRPAVRGDGTPVEATAKIELML